MPNLCLTNAYGVSMNKGSCRFDLTDGRDKNSIGEGKHRRKAGSSITWR